MKVILNVDYVGLGEEGDRIDVKDGYARNYLIPKRIAMLDTPQARAYFASRMKAIEQRKEEKRQRSRDVKAKLADMEVKFVLPASDTGKIFGSVTPTMISEYLGKEGIEIERKKIEVNSKDIKTAGNYSFVVSLYGGDTQTVKLVVEAEKKEVKLSEKELRKPRRPKEEDGESGSDAQESGDSAEATETAPASDEE